MLFIPGAKRAKWSLPKYDWPAPAATTSESYAVMLVWSSTVEVTVWAARSISATSPSRTRELRWRLKISRVAGAISPSDRMPVATW